MSKSEIKQKCAKQDFKGELEIHDGCEGGANAGLFSGKCEKKTIRKISCEDYKD